MPTSDERPAAAVMQRVMAGAVEKARRAEWLEGEWERHRAAGGSLGEFLRLHGIGRMKTP